MRARPDHGERGTARPADHNWLSVRGVMKGVSGMSPYETVRSERLFLHDDGSPGRRPIGRYVMRPGRAIRLTQPT